MVKFSQAPLHLARLRKEDEERRVAPQETPTTICGSLRHGTRNIWVVTRKPALET